jgi:2-polyprenyl-3-methyl-5-hydroxy-6-metoxy-1,4-benzoquinol methylase
MCHVCPWWLTYTFDNPLRRWIQDPVRILANFVRPGMNVMDVGCGMGYFTIPLASLVGESGRVFAVDLQPQQLERVRVRSEQAGVAQRVELVHACSGSLGMNTMVDFVLAHWMVHEVPEQQIFLKDVWDHLVPGGDILIAEPKIHVSRAAFERTLTIAQEVGFDVQKTSQAIPLSHSAFLKRI